MFKKIISFCLILLLSVFTVYSQKSYTQSPAGPYISNKTYTQGADGIWYASYGNTIWQPPEYHSTVLYLKMDTATNSNGALPDSSFIGTNAIYRTETNSNIYWFESTCGVSSCYFHYQRGLYGKPVASLQFTNDFTMSVWVCSIGGADGFGTFSSYDGTAPYAGYDIGVGYRAGWPFNGPTYKTYLGEWNPAGSYRNDTSGYSLPARTWKLLTCVFTRSRTNMDYYVDGKLLSSVTFAMPTLNTFSSTNIYLGVGVGGTTYGLFGWSDDYIIWQKTLSSNQVADIFNNTYQTHGWSNSYAISQPSFYKYLVAEYHFDFQIPPDTALTNNLTSYTGVNAYDPLLVIVNNQGHVSFDGNNDYLQAPASTNFCLNVTSGDEEVQDVSFTISMWLKINTYGYVFAKGGEGTGREYSGYIGNSDKKFYFKMNSYLGSYRSLEVNTDVGLPTNKWVHLAFTYDGSETGNGFNFYTNGIAVTHTSTTNGVYIGCRNSGNAFRLGTTTDSSAFYNGAIDAWSLGKGIKASSNQVYSLYLTSTNGHTN